MSEKPSVDKAGAADIVMDQSAQNDANPEQTNSDEASESKLDKDDATYVEPTHGSPDQRASASRKPGQKPNLSKANQQAAGLLSRLLDNLDDTLPALRTFKRNAVTKLFK